MSFLKFQSQGSYAKLKKKSPSAAITRKIYYKIEKYRFKEKRNLVFCLVVNCIQFLYAW